MTSEGAPPFDRHISLASQLRASIRGSSLYAPIRRKRLDQLARRPSSFPDWAELLKPYRDKWQSALETRNGPRVLIATNIGLQFTANAIDSLVATALTFRGANVDILLCDGVLPACQLVDHVNAPNITRYAKHGPQTDFCSVCSSAGLRHFSALGLNVIRLSSFVDQEEQNDALSASAEFADKNLNPSEFQGPDEHGYAGALRFFGRALLPDTSLSKKILARHLAAARLADNAVRRILMKNSYDVVVAHHGIYSPQGAVASATHASGVDLVTWHTSYRKGRLIFEHGDTYHRTMINEPVERWRAKALSNQENKALDEYLNSRITGSQDWITFQRAAPQSTSELESSLRISFNKPTSILIGNVAWDARLHYETSAYGEMTQWAADTVRWYAARPDLQLIVRCHPGEVMSSPQATDKLEDAVRSAFTGPLPKNIVIVPAESHLNTYALASRCGAALIYNTKMGIELAARGMPLVVAGDAWVRGKGFSYDASSPEEYFDILAKVDSLAGLSNDKLEAARRYAFHFFFRRCIPVDAFDMDAGWPLCVLSDDAVAKAMPSVDVGLNIICDGIMFGMPFQYDGNSNHT